MDVIYRISKLVVWCGDSFPESYRYKEVGFTKNKELIEKLQLVKIGDEKVWPICCMKNWPMYRLDKIDLLDDWDSTSDFVINPDANWS